ncbi:hypothetical protein [Sphingomonas yabuuchiae]|uniref:Uncharacterized protein n=1 Tax=Sphingomonas yabuuchiae TaxID=172044 RepID=A0AA40ZVM0_9SPHN|nr:hypothetical protein [Sphingomonas yabuuchiae]MBB4611652.1 hypothetical protein [Sphingomonas yabuuchiae]MBN3556760.1 hypothetical protein [Sphingomonas yabuuchiae]
MEARGSKPAQKVVQGEIVELDGAALFDTIYLGCRLVYKGGPLPILNNVTFQESNFIFAGDAFNTAQFMRMMVSAGAADVVKGMVGLGE